jgi:hypothetical protein
MPAVTLIIALIFWCNSLWSTLSGRAHWVSCQRPQGEVLYLLFALTGSQIFHSVSPFFISLDTNEIIEKTKAWDDAQWRIWQVLLVAIVFASSLHLWHYMIFLTQIHRHFVKLNFNKSQFKKVDEKEQIIILFDNYENQEKMGPFIHHCAMNLK